MKRFAAILLALVMLFGAGSVVMATNPADMTSITLTKTLTKQGKNPAETFNFTVEEGTVKEGSATSAPTIGSFSIDVAQDAGSGTHTLNLPTFTQVGRYEYEITETLGSTAGMEYDTTSRILVVQVFRDSNNQLIRVAHLKLEDGIKPEDVATNKFKSGNLTIKKVLAGNFTDPNDTFTVTVTLASDKDINWSTIAASGSTNINEAAGTITYTVKDGSEFTIENIPYDVDYTVVETGFDGYDPVYEVSYDVKQNGEMNAKEIETVITNKRNQDIIVGVNLDNLPYILTMVVGIGAIVFLATRKRKFE